MMKVGILSTASIVPRFIGALREINRAEVYAVASRDLEKAKAFAAQYEIPVAYGSYEEVLADPQVDLVYIAMVNSLHYTWTKKALEAGKHVICEKPFTLNGDQAQELFDLAQEKKLFLVEAQKSVFLPTMIDVKNLLAGGELGNVQFADFTSSCDPVYNGWLHDQSAGGGALAGNASYSMHLAQFLFDAPITASSGLLIRADSEVDEQCAINLELGGRIMFVSKISTNVKAIDHALIFCDKGYIDIPDYWKARKATVTFRTGEVRVIEHPCKYELKYELAHFFDCIDQGLLTSPVMSEKMTVETLKALDQIR